MTQDEFDRKLEFLLQSAAKFAADHEINMQWHAEFSARMDQLHGELIVLRDACNAALDNTTQLGELMTRTFEAIDRRQDRTDRELDKLAKIVFGHVSDPHAHDPAQA